jgi:hypothetical protein
LERQTTKKKNTLLLQSSRDGELERVENKEDCSQTAADLFIWGKGAFRPLFVKKLNKIPYIMYFYVSFLQCFGTGTGSFCPCGIGIRTGMHSGSGSGSVFGFGSNIKME